MSRLLIVLHQEYIVQRRTNFRFRILSDHLLGDDYAQLHFTVRIHLHRRSLRDDIGESFDDQLKGGIWPALGGSG